MFITVAMKFFSLSICTKAYNFATFAIKKVKVGNDQETAQSERKPSGKNKVTGGKKH